MEDVSKCGASGACYSRRCASKRPPSQEVCSTYACHFSRDFRPGQAWKFYYRQQKIQEVGYRKRILLNNICRCYNNEFMYPILLEIPPETARISACGRLPSKQAPDFYVRPWQQQFVPKVVRQPYITMTCAELWR